MRKRAAVRHGHWVRTLILLAAFAGVAAGLTYLIDGMVADCPNVQDCSSVPQWLSRQYAVILLLPIVFQTVAAGVAAEMPPERRQRWRVGTLTVVLAYGGLFVAATPEFAESFIVFTAGAVAVAVTDATIDDVPPKRLAPLLDRDDQFVATGSGRSCGPIVRGSTRYTFVVADANRPNLVRSLNAVLTGRRRTGLTETDRDGTRLVTFGSADLLILEPRESGTDWIGHLHVARRNERRAEVEAILALLVGPRCAPHRSD